MSWVELFLGLLISMANLRSILMLLSILLGIFLPQAHVLSPLMPFLIGLMMVLTFVSKVPPQKHGATFKIELHAFLVGLVLSALLVASGYLFLIPQPVILGGMILCFCPPANAAPVMSKLLGGNPVLSLKIFILGHIIACFSIPFIFGYFCPPPEGMESLDFLGMSKSIFNSIQPIITIPLAIALGLRSFYPEVADKVEEFQKYTMFVWIANVFVIISKASYDIRKMGFKTLWDSGEFQMMAVLSLVLCILLFFLGWFFERKSHPIEGSQSMGQKNTMLVIWIAQIYAGPVAALCPVCYVVWQNLVLSWMSWSKKKKSLKLKTV